MVGNIVMAFSEDTTREYMDPGFGRDSRRMMEARPTIASTAIQDQEVFGWVDTEEEVGDSTHGDGYVLLVWFR